MATGALPLSRGGAREGSSESDPSIERRQRRAPPLRGGCRRRRAAMAECRPLVEYLGPGLGGGAALADEGDLGAAEGAAAELHGAGAAEEAGAETWREVRPCAPGVGADLGAD